MSDDPAETARPGAPLELAGAGGRAVVWGLETADLNVNLVAWPAGDGVGEHVNAEVDVLLVVAEGEMSLRVDGNDLPLRAGQAVVVPKGVRRSIVAGPDGVRYLSAHRRRAPLRPGQASRERRRG